MSNLTSVSVIGTKGVRVEEIPEQESEISFRIPFDFEVDEPSPLPAVLAGAQDLGMILKLGDAGEFGPDLLALGLESQTVAEVDQVLARLSRLMREYRFGGE
ncbi:hypothetical protein [Lyngbya confervoides]|uniref:Uncharacterized protein n=1 Tax=Lyngbya confervoides BDU141951 TaxID=1574623 RepID=A0ABD4SZN7_9CYAN|nr:hypothetical protein [Lyngbya confervoides]MCM1981932.1 hypothetical protein [Lyngbya confervoides BDU141951]